MDKKYYNPFLGFTIFDWCVWLVSLIGIALSFFLCKNTQYLYLVASILGATALIFLAKGNVLGQILSVVFSGFYAYVSYTFAYYGEMITYLGLTAPMAIFAVITWLKNPYRQEGKQTEVKVNQISRKEHALALSGGVAVATIFYFILRAMDTPNLIFSTVSVLTSFLAVYYTARRSPLYALWYALNDVVLIVLWALASAESLEYLCMVVCFAVFLFNDLYGFLYWLRMKKRQAQSPTK